MKCKPVLRIILAALLLVGTAGATETTPPADSAPPATMQKQAPPQADKNDKIKPSEGNKSPDTFIPSEQLSNDQSASFPVDI